MVQKEFLIKKNFGSERILACKKFDSESNFGPKKIGFQKIWYKKMCPQKNLHPKKSFRAKKILGPKKFCFQKNLRFKNILFKKNLGSEKSLGPKKFESERNFGLKKSGPKKFG